MQNLRVIIIITHKLALVNLNFAEKGIFMNILPYLFAILKNVVYGSSVFFTSELSESTDVLDILALRFLVSFAVMWLLKVMRVIKIRVGLRDICRRQSRFPLIRSLLLAALFEPVLYMLFETAGISMTTNITAAVIISLSPITSCIMEVLVLKEKSTLLQKLFLLLGIAGVLYIALNTDTKTGEDTLPGILLLFASVVVGSLFAAFSRKASRAFTAMEITYVSCMLGAFIFNLINLVRHLFAGTVASYFSPYFDPQNMVGFLFLGVLSTIVATGMNNYAMSKIQLSTMAAFSGLSTLVTILVGVMFRGERLYAFHFIGLALILARMIGVSVISIRRDRKRVSAEKDFQTTERST